MILKVRTCEEISTILKVRIPSQLAHQEAMTMDISSAIDAARPTESVHSQHGSDKGVVDTNKTVSAPTRIGSRQERQSFFDTLWNFNTRSAKNVADLDKVAARVNELLQKSSMEPNQKRLVELFEQKVVELSQCRSPAALKQPLGVAARFLGDKVSKMQAKAAAMEHYEETTDTAAMAKAQEILFDGSSTLGNKLMAANFMLHVFDGSEKPNIPEYLKKSEMILKVRTRKEISKMIEILSSGKGVTDADDNDSAYDSGDDAACDSGDDSDDDSAC
eukprot:Polyplicarium_translucidae@DN224_c0_g1_i1.p1